MPWVLNRLTGIDPMLFQDLLFQDRRDAGRKLAEMVAGLPGIEDAVVLGLARGGLPVAYEIARVCRLPLDVLMVRKLGAPGQPELAIGAVTSGGVVALNSELVRVFHLSDDDLRAMTGRALEEIARREQAYRQGAPSIEIEGRTAILVDDGLATGASMKSAARAIRPRARQVIISVPVAATRVCRQMEDEADLVVCAATPEPLESVGQFYRDFSPTTDDEVRALLSESRRQFPAVPPP